MNPLKPMTSPLLTVENLRVDFGVGPHALHAVRGVDFTVHRGETLGIVGESGSGKSVTALSILRLITSPGRIVDGRILLAEPSPPTPSPIGMGEGTVEVTRPVGHQVDLLKVPEKALRDIRGSRIAMVFQDPLTSLNPVLTIGDQIVETLREHREMSKREAWAEAEALLRQVNMTLPERRLRQYPFELSGGMRQRAMIALAFSCRPELLIADEPTTALDVTVQAQILDLMGNLKKDYGASVILITHDLGIVAERCDNVAVMYAGQIVEYASAAHLFASPQHPYTRALLTSVPDWRRPRTDGPLPALPGHPPDLTTDFVACPFAPRCPEVMAACMKQIPARTELDGGRRYVRCLRVE